MNPYIENPAIARAMADNERRQAESDAAEAQTASPMSCT